MAAPGVLVGAELHGFTTMYQLQMASTISHDRHEWYSNEITTAMLLNPAPFSWPQGVDLDDRGFTTDCYSFRASAQQFEAMAQAAGPITIQHGFWPYYTDGILVPGVFKEDRYVGTKKNKTGHRRRNVTEIASLKYETKGTFRCRWRTMLPDNFEIVAHYPNPHPGSMIVQYQFCPNASVAQRVQRAVEMQANVEQLRQLLGAAAVPLHAGPARPPWLLGPFLDLGSHVPVGIQAGWGVVN